MTKSKSTQAHEKALAALKKKRKDLVGKFTGKRRAVKAVQTQAKKPSAVTVAMAEEYFKSDEEFDPFEHLNLPFDDIPTKVGKDEMCARCSYRDIPRCPMKGTDLCAKIRGRAD